MVLFVGLLLALGVAYFLGVMTGMTGRETTAAAVAPIVSPEPTEKRAAAREASPAPESNRAAAVPAVTFPKPVLGLGTEPTAPPTLQLFEDRGGVEPTPVKRAALKATTPPPVPAAGELWVQVVSVSSAKEANAASERLKRRGHSAAVSPAPGPRGMVYRVRVGPFHSREQAAKAAQQLSQEEKVETWIVPAGK